MSSSLNPHHRPPAEIGCHSILCATFLFHSLPSLCSRGFPSETQCCGSASSRSGSGFLFRWRSRSGSGSYPKFYTCWKIRIFFGHLFTGVPVTLFHFSRQRNSCHNKKYSSALFGKMVTYRSGSAKKMPIRPDLYPQHCC